MNDKIFIEGIRINCLIGINPNEREIKQEIIINISIETDFSKVSDNINNTINYSSVYKFVKKFVTESKYFLIETLGDELAKQLMIEFNINKLDIEVIKPSVFDENEIVSIKLSRTSK